ncbi:MAG TPA: GlxA family transcriptional regulator [Mycoplana sp.]|nr:GlxA family transcriptional regulator [Mycoplana sp.]
MSNLNRALRSPIGRGGRTASLSVGVVLLKRFTLCAFANFIDVLRLAADEGDRSRPIHCQWSVISADMQPIASSCGIAIQPQARFGDPGRFDYIVIVGGLVDEIAQKDELVDGYLRQAAAAGVPLVGLCTGAFVLHRAGLMRGYRCCVSWFHHADFLEQFDGLRPVSDQIFVVDRDRLTCSGGASAAHLAAFLVERHVGRAQATKSLHIMMISEAAVGETPQPGLPANFETNDPVVRKALLIMQQSLDIPLPIKVVAARMQTDKRRLERRFQSALNSSPLSVYLAIRLDYARHLIEMTERSVASIAADCGFCDSSHFARMYTRRFGSTPGKHRDFLRAGDDRPADALTA